ncbi:MAG: copper homeostasis protein CutC [Oscillospiraceae bacterium]
MQSYILEACVDSVESAVAAARGGATRLELCANLMIGGTTPSPFLFEAVRRATKLPVNVLIRPRFGDFLYTDAEYAIMCREIASFSARGANAVVVGALCPDGSLDQEKMAGMIRAAHGVHVTLHRAFDVCRDPVEALEQAVELGVDTILTSGQQENAWAGRELLGTLLSRAAGRAEILIGGGVNAAVIRDIRRLYPQARAFHLSGKTVLHSGMVYRNEAVYMGLPGISEFQLWRTSEEAIRRAAEALGEE